jgi:curved DNA-binding protein CbpA
MGNQQSVDPKHVDIYRKLIQIQSVQTRAQTIHTILTGPEYVVSAKITGIYAALLGYVSAVQSGRVPNRLPGEQTATATATATPSNPIANAVKNIQSQVSNYIGVQMNSFQRVSKQSHAEKAKSYFDACLEILGVKEDQDLNEEILKKLYKRASLKVHPDKGGSEEEFKAITKAYEYLCEISRRVRGGRLAEGVVEAPNKLADTRAETAVTWKQPEESSIRLNPKSLNLNAFNELFDKNKLPDPEGDGYGDWLKNEDATQSAKYSGKYNREVFHRTFEDEVQKQKSTRGLDELAVRQPAAMMLSPMAVELGRDKPDDYTAPANSGLNYTDLKNAYTTNATFSGEVAGVRVENRDVKQFERERKSAPEPLRDDELQRLQAAEMLADDREKMRKRRAAQEDVMAEQYFHRMKQYVINN